VHDLSADSAAGFRSYLEHSGTSARLTVHDTAEELIRGSDLVVFATVSAEPYVSDVSCFDHAPLVLHVSLRDLAPEVLLASTNLVDDVEHCLKANTSPHLVEQMTGSRDFLLGTLADVMTGRVTVPEDRPVVFSPFGLGVLDLAVGKAVYDEIAAAGQLHVVEDFFSELRRHG
jgi:ornithine cyclodeaminase/alanine dehydrogenase-like protein (mu-crystallin family)